MASRPAWSAVLASALKINPSASERRYSVMPPGAQLSRRSSCCATSKTCSSVLSLKMLFCRRVSTDAAQIVRAAIPPNATVASSTSQPLLSELGSRSSRLMPAETIAISSSLRRAVLNACTYSHGRLQGTLTCSNISSASISTSRYPVKKFLAATSLSPRDLDIIINTARAAIHIGFKSEIGLAVTMFPPSAAMLRIWRPANHLSCSRIALRPLTLYESAVSLDSATMVSIVSHNVDQVTPAPITRPALVRSIAHNSGMRLARIIAFTSMCLKRRSMPSSVKPTNTRADGQSETIQSRRSSEAGIHHWRLFLHMYTSCLPYLTKSASSTFVLMFAPALMVREPAPVTFAHGCRASSSMSASASDLNASSIGR
mmetsp:Transcript_6925/g.18552  ORF Transcript_6925/g.18552 Transcript_6925/m.18552 type:complete len:372 (-) Transcript_6925:539-1654(-)